MASATISGASATSTLRRRSVQKTSQAQLSQAADTIATSTASCSEPRTASTQSRRSRSTRRPLCCAVAMNNAATAVTSAASQKVVARGETLTSRIRIAVPPTQSRGSTSLCATQAELATTIPVSQATAITRR